mmetsp:Transcript_64119/g.139549  ORF Transcript_64119/g.139549 Transcript_64119/m.139549 type:complete len:171 (-) Transcript_64119:1148-1660(-)
MIDPESFDLTCTFCGLILQERVVHVSLPDSTVNAKGIAKEDLIQKAIDDELVGAMRRLGIDNKQAMERATARSVWTKRDRAETWLESRRRVRRAQVLKQRQPERQTRLEGMGTTHSTQTHEVQDEREEESAERACHAAASGNKEDGASDVESVSDEAEYEVELELEYETF